MIPSHRRVLCINLNSTHTTYLNVLFPGLSVVDVPSLVASCKDRWYNQTLCKVNDSVVRLGVMQVEYHWHKHDNDDEFFFVLDGHFVIDLERKSIDLKPHQGYVVPSKLTRFINLLSLLLLVSISIKERIFTMALAFFTNQFAILFDDIPLSVAISTNHFNLLVGNVLG